METNLAVAIRAISFSLALGATTSIAAGNDSALVENGRKLALDAKCDSCHIAKVGGDGSAIYLRKDRRVTSKSKLLPQVERCNSQLSLKLFPDDEAAIAAHLNAAYYKFKD